MKAKQKQTKRFKVIRCQECGGIMVYGKLHACDEVGATFWNQTPRRIKNWFAKGLRRAES